MSELKSCPFCGAEAEQSQYHPDEVYCKFGSGDQDMRADAENWCRNDSIMTPEDWNTRAPDPRLIKAIEEIQSKADVGLSSKNNSTEFNNGYCFAMNYAGDILRRFMEAK